MFLPETIRALLPEAEFTLDDLGRSQAQVLLFEDCVLKIEKDCNASAKELNMMRWLHGKLPVPEVLAADMVEDTRYLLMSRIPGNYLCAGFILDDQERLADLVSKGLQQMWSVDITGCPTDRSLDAKFLEIETGIRNGSITMDQARQEETYGPSGFKSPAELFDWLVKHRPQEELVLSHGDFCLPNILCNMHGLTGFIDLGCAGVADKWVDIEMTIRIPAEELDGFVEHVGQFNRTIRRKEACF